MAPVAWADGVPVAASSPAPEAQTLIGDGAFNAATGIVGINEASGTGNVQANLAVIGTGTVSVRVKQRTDAVGTYPGTATISANAFAGAAGLIRVNQVSGAGNAQANVVVIHWGIPGKALCDDALAGALPQQSTSPANQRPSEGQQAVSVEATAFAGARGVVQLSQIAGSGNSTINDLSLQIHVGTTTSSP